jgi:hypothetical protein
MGFEDSALFLIKIEARLSGRNIFRRKIDGNYRENHSTRRNSYSFNRRFVAVNGRILDILFFEPYFLRSFREIYSFSDPLFSSKKSVAADMVVTQADADRFPLGICAASYPSEIIKQIINLRRVNRKIFVLFIA